jgi:HlyD family secretion protein
MRNTRALLTILILSLIVLSACSGAQEATPTPDGSADEAFNPVISATGRVVPVDWTALSLPTAGVVEQVLVSDNQAVSAGDALVRLQGKEQLQAAVTAAQVELTSAEQALQTLSEDVDLLAAQALGELESAQQALEDLQTPEIQEALALQALAEAEKAVDSADRHVRILKSTADQADIDAAKAQVVLAKDVLDDARDDYEKYADKPEDNLTRANLLARFSAAQQTYDAAVRKLNALQGTANEVDIAVAEADLAAAKAQLIRAEREWARVQDGPSEAEVARLEAEIAAAERDYANLQNGPDPDEVALAEARLANAQAQLDAAEAALDDLELRAPFNGRVSQISIHASEWVNPGQTVLLLADMSKLQVETTDLNEIDVARLQLGDAATITFDALPEAAIEGTIVQISPKSAEGSGVNFPVTLELSEQPAELLWGMTAFVDVELDR